jgi:hypothetical protein
MSRLTRTGFSSGAMCELPDTTASCASGSVAAPYRTSFRVQLLLRASVNKGIRKGLDPLPAVRYLRRAERPKK